MVITAAMVKELRERTGAGMMECKKSLVEANGDMGAAADILRKAGAARADKKAGRVAAEGVVTIVEDGNAMAILEVNCETDFAARNTDFTAYAEAVAKRVLADRPANLDALNNLPLEDGGSSVADSLRDLIGKVGENMDVRRFEVVSGDNLGSYLHKVGPTARIGVIVALEGGNAALARDIAMHIAASGPRFIDADAVDREVLEKEKSILTEQAKEEAKKRGKPADTVEKMVVGRVNKFLKEITLLGQAFVKDTELPASKRRTVEKLLRENNARVTSFTRFELGEGVEKKEENFAEEVMAQAKTAQ